MQTMLKALKKNLVLLMQMKSNITMRIQFMDKHDVEMQSIILWKWRPFQS